MTDAEPSSSKDQTFEHRPDESPDLTALQRQTLTGAGDPTLKPREPSERDAVPGYEILEELGRGGMGVVYKARQAKLDRVVALKMILAGSHASAADVLRFLAEAEAEARLHHPNIVQLLESGQHEGLPYFTLEFVEGGTLGEMVAPGPLPPRESAALVEAIARGVAHAHAHGIVHRDLKPENVLLTASGSPKITDFGLAKRLQAGTGVTRTGAVMGTPGYMAPEQARGETVGTAVDIYALGAILYCTLTGRPPFRADTPLETINQVLRDDPVPPRKFNPKVPRDLEVICLKCLQKAPTKRYASAEALADDLQLFLEGRPITARPVGKAERLLKWVKRRPTAAALVIVAHLVALGALVAGVWFTAEIRDERDQTKAAFQAAERRAEAERLAKAESERQKRLAEATLIDMQTNFGVAAQEQNNSPVAALWFASAATIGDQGPERGFANRVRFDLARRDAVSPLRAFDHGGEELLDLQLHPDARYLLTQTKSGRLALWDVEAERPIPFPGEGPAPTAAVWSADGEWLAVARGPSVEVWSAAGGERVQELTHSEPVRVLAFSGDRGRLALAGNKARVWDCGERKFITAELAHPRPVVHLVFAPAGDLLATSCEDQRARVFPLREFGWPGPRTCAHLIHGYASLRRVRIPPAFAGGGQLLVTVSTPTTASGWDLVAGRGIWTQQGGESINSLTVSPDGATALVGGFTKVMALNARTGTEVRATRPHKHYASGLAHSSDGKFLISVSFDRTARISDARLGQLSEPVTHQDGILQLSAARTRNVFATAQFDGLVRVWAFAGEALPRLPYDGPGESAHRPALSPDGALCLPGTRGPVARVHTTADGRSVGAPLPLPGGMEGALFLPDGRSVLLWGSKVRTYADAFDARRQPGWFQRIDWKTGEQLLGPVETPGTVMAAAVGPGGRDLVLALANTQILVLDLATGGKERSVSFKTSDPTGWWYLLPVTVSFHPTEDRCVVGGLGKDVFHIDAARGEVLHRLDAGDKATTVLFAPGGELIVAGSLGKEVRFWNAATGEPALAPLPHPDWVFRVDFSADGKFLATAGRDNRARVWDWRSGELLAALEHPDEAYDARISPDNRWLFTISRDGKGRVWEWRAGKSVGPMLPFPPGLTQVPTLEARFTPDGRRLVCAALGLVATEGLLRAETGQLPATDRLRLGRLLAGQKIGANSNLVNLTSAEWLDEWRQFRSAHLGLLTLPAKSVTPAAPKIEPWPSSPIPDPTSVVKLPAAPRQYRAASVPEMVVAAARLGTADTAAAEKWLLEVGPPAAVLLAALERSAPPEKRPALRATRDRIDLAEALRPRTLGLKFDNTPLPTAVRLLGQAGGVPLTYTGRSDATVTLDLSGEAFWPAVQRLCNEAGLTLSGFGTEARLVEGKPRPAGWAAGAGPAQVLAMSVSRTNAVDLSGSGTPITSTQLSVMLFPDPRAPVTAVGYPRLRALEGADGKAIPLGTSAFQNQPETVRPGTIGFYRTVFLPAKAQGPLKRLEAVVPFEVEVRRREKVVVAGLAGAESRVVPIPGGGRLTVQTSRAYGTFTNIEVRVETAGLWDIDPRRHAVELVDDNGVRHRGGAFSPFSVPAGFAPEDLLAVGHPLANLAWQARLQMSSVRGRATLTVPPTAVTGTKSRLIFYEADRLRTEATFELRDLPLR